MKIMLNKLFDHIIKIFTTIEHINPVESAKINENVYAVKTETVNFFIYRKDDNYICFDAGFGKNLIKNQLRGLSINPDKITDLFLTHSDIDHTSGIDLFKNARIHIGSAEEPMITRQKARMFGFIYNPKIKRPYNLLNDNDIVKVGSIEIKAISTPGHTPGSMSYLVNKSILFVGDTFKLIGNKVYPIRSYMNMNTEQQKRSIRKLAHIDNVRMAFTAHRGYTKDFSKAISDWR